MSKMEFKIETDLYVIGDIHGQPQKITKTILETETLRGVAFVVLGDVGLGFYGNHLGPIKALNRLAEETNNVFYIFRGNHDCPESFVGEHREKAEKKYPNVRFLNDFDTVTLANGKRGLIVAGALSVDRNSCRMDYMTGEWRGREVGKQYWRNELMDYATMSTITEHYDFILAHGGPCPLSTGKNTGYIDDLSLRDSKLKGDLATEQDAVFSLIERVKPDYWINGHYHVNEVFDAGKTRVIAVDMETIAPLPMGLTLA